MQKINTCEQLSELVQEVGFIPLFSCSIPGFSVEELTPRAPWWTGSAEKDPWEWREQIASAKQITYGKFFEQKAAFVSREWFPVLAVFRRGGYDFQARYDAGHASKKEKDILDLLAGHGSLASHHLKRLAGYGGRGGEKGFDGMMARLQMQTYVTVTGFERKKDKFGQDYGWPASVYSVAESLFGEDDIDSCDLEPAEAKEKLVAHIASLFPDAPLAQINRFIR